MNRENYTAWRKSGRSGEEANCVEVSPEQGGSGAVGLRDSKDPAGRWLEFSPGAWAAFDRGHQGRRPVSGGDTAPITAAEGVSDSVVIEFIGAEDVPEQHRKENKVFEPGHQAIVISSAEDPSVRLYFTEAEWAAFTEGVRDGEFVDLLDELPGEGEQPTPQ